MDLRSTILYLKKKSINISNFYTDMSETIRLGIVFVLSVSYEAPNQDDWDIEDDDSCLEDTDAVPWVLEDYPFTSVRQLL
jgi:hypothetical protein